jgi:hypothetical protein
MRSTPFVRNARSRALTRIDGCSFVCITNKHATFGCVALFRDRIYAGLVVLGGSTFRCEPLRRAGDRLGVGRNLVGFRSRAMPSACDTCVLVTHSSTSKHNDLVSKQDVFARTLTADRCGNFDLNCSGTNTLRNRDTSCRRESLRYDHSRLQESARLDLDRTNSAGIRGRLVPRRGYAQERLSRRSPSSYSIQRGFVEWMGTDATGLSTLASAEPPSPLHAL